MTSTPSLANALTALLLGCHGSATLRADPSSEAAVPDSPRDQLSQRLRVSLPYGKARPVPVLGGTVTLVEASSDHMGEALEEVSNGVIELSRDGKAERIAFEANRSFRAWGYEMGVFGASGSFELGIFPPGVAFEP